MFQHKSVDIEVDRNGRFIATVDDLAINTTTLADAKTAIDKALAARAKPASTLKSTRDFWTRSRPGTIRR